VVYGEFVKRLTKAAILTTLLVSFVKIAPRERNALLGHTIVPRQHNDFGGAHDEAHTVNAAVTIDGRHATPAFEGMNFVGFGLDNAGGTLDHKAKSLPYRDGVDRNPGPIQNKGWFVENGTARWPHGNGSPG